jgi:hypothetical protein
MSVSMNLPSVLLSLTISRSPCSTWISTDGWLSSAVVNTSERLVGMVVLRSISLWVIPPLVSIPSDSGVTSSSRTSFTSPLRTPACRAAPIGDDLVRVDALVGLLATGELLDEVLDGGDAGRATDEDHVIDPLAEVAPASLSARWNGPFSLASRSPVSSLNFAGTGSARSAAVQRRSRSGTAG